MNISPSLVLISILSLVTVAAKTKNRIWGVGELLASREQSLTLSDVTTEQGHAAGIIDGGGFNRTKESYQTGVVWQEYTIEAGGYRFLAKQPLPWRWSKPAVLTIGGLVRFAVEGRSLYLLDDTGKEYKMELIRRVNPVKVGQSHKTNAAMTNADVLKLKEADLSDALIVEKIKSSPCAFKLDTDALVDLKKAGLSDVVIAAMIHAENFGK